MARQAAPGMRALPRWSRTTGATLPEMLSSTLILGLIMAGMGTLFAMGIHQSSIARNYSEDNTNLIAGLGRMTRALRHGLVVESPGDSSFSPTASNSTQAIVLVPEPTGSSSSTVQLRLYLTGGTLYLQRKDEAAAGTLGTAMVQNCSSIAIHYWQTIQSSTGVVRTQVDSAPAGATELDLWVTVTGGNTGAGSGITTTSMKALVFLRNTALSS